MTACRRRVVITYLLGINISHYLYISCQFNNALDMKTLGDKVDHSFDNENDRY